MIASGLVALAIALPWLALAPLAGPAAAAAHAIALVAAFHGAGLAVARLANRRDDPPLLVVQWGIAALIGLSGIAIACRVGTFACHLVLVLAGLAVHSAALGRGFRRHAARARAALAGPRAWLVPATLLVGLGALAVLGATGDSFLQPFDDDGHLLGQLRRLLDTGALSDAIGYPRRGGLGAQVALAALGAAAGNVSIPAAAGLVHALDPLGAVLALGLAASLVGAREPGRALWGALVIAAGLALAVVLAPPDPLPCWTAVGLLVALYWMLGERGEPAPLPLALTAGALACLRYEFAPVAALALVAAWWRQPRDHRRMAILLAGALAVVLPFLVARALAWRVVPGAAAAVLAAARPAPLALRAALAVAIAVPGALVLRIALPPRHGTAATATAVALGALATHVTGAGAYSLRLAAPIAIGFVLTMVIERARRPPLGHAALLAALALCLAIHETTIAPGQRRWARRLAAAASELETLARPPAAGADRYADLLDRIPRGATVAVWVALPEQLDHARHRIIDLRSPAAARLREHRWAAHTSKLERLLAGVAASYLLVEDDDARELLVQSDVIYRLACQTPRPICADDLEAVVLHHPAVAERENVRLVDLGR